MKCEVCKMDEAKVFVKVQQGDRIAKAHTCMDCFENFTNLLRKGEASEISQSEFNAIKETAQLK